MVAVVKAFPFPWASREAQQLLATLCEMYPSSKRALAVAENAGLNLAMLNQDQDAFMLWRDILKAGAGAQRNEKVVTAARDLNLEHPHRQLLEDFLAQAQTGAAVAIEGEPRGADGAPVFLSKSDQIGENEALLFHDNLTLEIGKVPWLIDVLQKMQALAPAVCKLATNFTDGGRGGGTAFRIAPTLLMTNWHVLHDIKNPANKLLKATAEFGFDDDGKGGSLQSTALPCDVTTVAGDATCDWAIITPAGALPATVPILKLSEATEATSGTPAFIVQHPGGGTKRIAFVRNQVTDVDDRTVHYLSDTQPGSSGSPVFHESGRLMALHRIGGRPQEVAGKQPLRKNEGVRIQCIIEKMGQLGIAVP